MPVCEKEWKIIRITRELAARLDAWRTAQLTRGRKGVQRVIGEKYATISYNAAIRELLDRDERHRERGKRTKRKGKEIKFEKHTIDSKLQAIENFVALAEGE